MLLKPLEEIEYSVIIKTNIKIPLDSRRLIETDHPHPRSLFILHQFASDNVQITRTPPDPRLQSPKRRGISAWIFFKETVMNSDFQIYRLILLLRNCWQLSVTRKFRLHACDWILLWRRAGLMNINQVGRSQSITAGRNYYSWDLPSL